MRLLKTGAMRLLRSGAFTLLTLVGLALPSLVHADDAWPHWLGPRYASHATTSENLELGPDSTLEIAWKQPLGSGYSGISIDEGSVVTLFASGGSDWVGAFDADTGKPRWRFRMDAVHVGYDGSHDGPIASPAIAQGRVVALDARGRLVALDLRNGEASWSLRLVEDHGVEKPHYGFAVSPLIHKDLVIVGTGTGESPTFSAFDLGSGELRWQTPGTDVLTDHSPILLPRRNGGFELVAAARERLSGWNPEDGSLLWQLEHGGRGAAASVVALGDDRLSFNTSWPETISVARTPGADGAIEIEESWKTKALGKSYDTPIYFDGHLFGFNGAFLTCLDAETGERKWRSRAPGDGFLIRVDDHLVTLTRTGELHLAPASADGYQSVASTKVLDTASWTGPSFARDLIYVRGFEELAAVRIVRAGAGTTTAESLPGQVEGSILAELAQEVAATEDKAAVVDRFLERHDRQPIVEGEELVHIVYHGPAQEVALAGDMFLGAPYYFVKEQRPLHRIAGTDLFYYSLRLETDARVNYQLSIDLGDPVPDPLNPTVVDVDRVGQMSVLTMPSWRPVEEPAEPSTAGSIEAHKVASRILERELALEVYLPPGYGDSERSYPAFYVSDGKLAGERGQLGATLDARSAAGKPAIAVLIVDTGWGEHVGGRRDAYAEALVKEVVPWVDDRYRTAKGAAERVAVGCGEGGVVSLLAALAHPGVFARVGSLSAYALPDLSTQIQELARASNSPDLEVHLEWGKYDLRTGEGNLDIPAENRRLAEILSDSGFTVSHREVPEGFGWATWRFRVGRLLDALAAAD